MLHSHIFNFTPPKLSIKWAPVPLLVPSLKTYHTSISWLWTLHLAIATSLPTARLAQSWIFLGQTPSRVCSLLTSESAQIMKLTWHPATVIGWTRHGGENQQVMLFSISVTRPLLISFKVGNCLRRPGMAHQECLVERQIPFMRWWRKEWQQAHRFSRAIHLEHLAR